MRFFSRGNGSSTHAEANLGKGDLSVSGWPSAKESFRFAVAFILGCLAVGLPLYFFHEPSKVQVEAVHQRREASSASFELPASPSTKLPSVSFSVSASPGLAPGRTPEVSTLLPPPTDLLHDKVGDATNLPGLEGDAQPGRLSLSSPTIVFCTDSRGRKQSRENCARLAQFETELTQAISNYTSCVPEKTLGTMTYVIDVYMKRRRMTVIVPRSGRTIQDSKVIKDCALGIKGLLLKSQVMDREHSATDHYRYEINASYTF